MCANGAANMEGPGDEAGRSARPAPPAPPAPHAPHTPHNGSNKIIGRNVNGTMVVTHAPANEAELQLYRVMQRASLLNYYDTLLEMGGDDVQQLCDAGEEEFLEIMALVGMASKPLHVRRLQKALQEWVSNPALFQIPIVPGLCSAEPSFVPCGQRLMGAATVLPRTVASPDNGRPAYSPSPGAPENSCGSTTSAPNVSPGRNHTPPVSFTKIVLPASPIAPTPASVPTRSFSPQAPVTSAGSSPSSATSPIQLTPILLDVQVQKLASAAEKLSKHLPQLEPKPQNTKKKMCKDLELVMMMPESDPKRMEEIRKYAAIYGRFDCKRKPEKPLTLHEVMVNEAAAQMCRCVPALLTRRDELFPLARQVVRRAGLHYSKHGLPSGGVAGAGGEDRSDGEETPSKRPRQDGDDGSGASRTSPEAVLIGRDARVHCDVGGGWWGAGGRSGPPKAESDDADSRCSYSSATSATPPPENEESRPQVVAARGDSIIAVANPALQPRAHAHALVAPPARPARNHSN